jgi:hypothetical protein
MFKYFIFSCLVVHVTSCNPVRHADNIAGKDAGNQKKTMFPKQSFDSLAAKGMLVYGNVTIKGVIYKKTNKMAVVGGKTYGSFVTVTLYPVTPYFMEWYEMREKYENKRTNVYISNEAFKYRIEIASDAYGRFQFEKMRPGKYFIQAVMTTSKSYKRDVEVGSNSYGTRYYQKQQYFVSKKHRLEQFVEVQNGSGVVEVVLK